MYYFDNRLLGQYLKTGVDVKVFVNGVYYVLASPNDVTNPVIGYGYDLNGGTFIFDYRAIDHILVNGSPISIEQLEKAFTSKNEPEEQSKDKPESKKEPKEKDSKEDDVKKEESISIGAYVQNIDPSSTDFKTKGSVILSEDGFATYEYYSTKTRNMTRKTVPISNLKKIG